MAVTFTEIFFIVIIAILVSYIVLMYLRPSSMALLTPNEGRLDRRIQLAQSDQVRNLWLSPSASTFNIYLYFDPNQRTSSISTSPTDILTLFNIGSSFEFQILTPGVSKSEHSVRIRVKTASPSGTMDEYISAPSLPIQKWTLLSIVRDARRYTIYYNNKPISSGRTTDYPIIQSGSMYIGNEAIKGHFKKPQLISYAWTNYDITNYMSKTADTRGKPYENSTVYEFFTFSAQTVSYALPKSTNI
jgi:hypothetical protein